MTPTDKQLTPFDAVLACISAAGYDPNAAINAADADIKAGVPVLTAYSRALNSYVSTLPAETQGTIGKIARLVAASDDATIAQYDAAIEAYNASEGNDESAIEALFPMMAQDGLALALHNREITQAEIDRGEGIAAALGYEPSPEAVAALQSPAPEAVPAPQAAAPVHNPAQAPAAPQAAPSQPPGIVRDQHGNVSYSSRRIAAPAAPAPTAGVVRDQTGYSYSSARHGAKAEQWAGRAGRHTSFQPIVRQPVEPGHGPTLEKAGAQLTG